MRIVFQTPEKAASIARATDRVANMLREGGADRVEIIEDTFPAHDGKQPGEGYFTGGRRPVWRKLYALVTTTKIVDL